MQKVIKETVQKVIKETGGLIACLADASKDVRKIIDYTLMICNMYIIAYCFIRYIKGINIKKLFFYV